jgi:hypothetical protein
MKGDRRVGGAESRVRRALTAVAISVAVAAAVSLPVALRVADSTPADDPGDTTSTQVGVTVTEPEPPSTVATVPPSVLRSTVERDDPEAGGG